MAELPQDIVAEVISSLKSEVFLPNDIIVKAGTPGDCMYFLETGTVSVLTKNGKEVFQLNTLDGLFKSIFFYLRSVTCKMEHILEKYR